MFGFGVDPWLHGHGLGACVVCVCRASLSSLGCRRCAARWRRLWWVTSPSEYSESNTLERELDPPLPLLLPPPFVQKVWNCLVTLTQLCEMITMCWWDLAGSFVHLCFTGFVQSCQLFIVRQRSRIENGVKSLQQCARNEWDVSLTLLWVECVDCGHPIVRIPSFWTKSRTFSYQASVIWNQLPVSVCHSTSVSSFQSSLKNLSLLKNLFFTPIALTGFAQSLKVFESLGKMG